MIRRVGPTLLLILGAAAQASAQAQTTPKPSPPSIPIDVLVTVVDADPLELGRVAQRLGDKAVISRLDERAATEVRLAATRATPYLREPERALLPLASMISGRDTLLAQAAARSVITIVRALDADQLQRREVFASELAPVRAELERAAAIEHLRPDLRAIAASSAAMLTGMGVPLPR